MQKKKGMLYTIKFQSFFFSIDIQYYTNMTIYFFYERHQHPENQYQTTD